MLISVFIKSVTTILKHFLIGFPAWGSNMVKHLADFLNNGAVLGQFCFKTKLHYKKYFWEKVKFTIPNGRMTLDSVVKYKFYKTFLQNLQRRR